MISILLLATLGRAEESFSARLAMQIQQNAAAVHGIAPSDVDVLSTGFAGEGCGDSMVVTSRPGEDYIGAVDLRVTAYDQGIQCGQWRVRTRQALWLDLPVAVQAAAAGETLQLRMDRIRIERSPGTPVSMSGGPYVARTGVRSGQVVVTELTKALPDVGTGQLVNVVVHSGQLVIRSEGYLAQPGNIGDPVRVRSTATNTILHGTLVATDQVVID